VLRIEKTKVVEGMAESFGQTPHVFLTTFRGLTVNQATELRRKVRETGGSFKVVKNRLAKRAAPGTSLESISDRLEGPCALAAHVDDPVALAKVLAEFSKTNPELEVLGGVIDAHQSLDAAGVKQLASLPGLPELRAQLLAMIQTPATMLVRLLGTPGGQVARVLDARREKQEKGE
jgi:large subunit ribosomal protein L10